MPDKGRTMPFGHSVQADLYVAEGDENTFGKPPDLEDSPIIRWKLVRNENAYDLFDLDAANTGTKTASLSFRKLHGTRRLYVAQFASSEDMAEGPEITTRPAFIYVLVWRASKHEFVGFRDFPFNNGQCAELELDDLMALGFSSADIEECRAHSWKQVENLMRVYAKSGPEPIGTMRVIRNP